ncbi:hypothetical protein DV736_g3925, partial [Chaetothyriales sp. CBS 134916]
MKEAPALPPHVGSDQPPPPLENEAPVEWFYNYTAVEGYFLQDNPETDAASFDFKKHNFGLIDRPYESDGSIIAVSAASLTPWQRFAHHLVWLNEGPSALRRTTSYRLLFLGRHGQGYHNVAESYYGPENWDCYWSLREGNGTVTWADAHLTELGIAQAQEGHEFWLKQIDEQQIVTPDSFYVSPLDRAVNTADITFRDLPLATWGGRDQQHQEGRVQYRPLIKEMLREGNGLHTCDRRSMKSEIAVRWPDYRFEDGFTEQDKLWRADLRESGSALRERLRGLLDDVFEHDDSTVISFTAHSGVIGAILEATGHRRFPLQTGGVIPVLLKVDRVQGKRPKVDVDPWEPKPDCEEGENHRQRAVSFEDFMHSPESTNHV